MRTTCSWSMRSRQRKLSSERDRGELDRRRVLGRVLARLGRLAQWSLAEAASARSRRLQAARGARSATWRGASRTRIPSTSDARNPSCRSCSERRAPKRSPMNAMPSIRRAICAAVCVVATSVVAQPPTDLSADDRSRDSGARRELRASARRVPRGGFRGTVRARHGLLRQRLSRPYGRARPARQARAERAPLHRARRRGRSRASGRQRADGRARGHVERRARRRGSRRGRISGRIHRRRRPAGASPRAP